MDIGKLKKPKILVKNFNEQEKELYQEFKLSHLPDNKSVDKILEQFFARNKADRQKVQNAVNYWLSITHVDSIWTRLKYEQHYKYFGEFLECNEISDYVKAIYINMNRSMGYLNDFVSRNLSQKKRIYYISSYYNPYVVLEDILEKKDIKALSHMSENFSSYLWCNNSMDKLSGTNDRELVDKVADLNPRKIGEFLVFFTRGLSISRKAKKYWPISDKTIYKILEVNGSAITRIPKPYITKKMFKLAVAANGLNIKYVPKDKRTKELYELAMERSATAVKYVPKEFQNKGLIMKLVLKGKNPLKYVKD